MKTLDDLIVELADRWAAVLGSGRRGLQLMEVCGTHTVAVGRGGLRDLLPRGLRLVSGPGCPVCVTDQSYMDQAVALSHRPDVAIATYGDMLRVPGMTGSLEQSRSKGADITVVYSAHEAVALARRRPEKKVVFLAVGFETTTPATALAILQAQAEGLKNFYAFTAHKRVIPAMAALLASKEAGIDGFLCPGHVSVIIGSRAYQPLADEFHLPFVVAGFDEEQIIQSIIAILDQIARSEGKVASVYPIVSEEGNAVAQRVIERVFQVGDAIWRALGTIPQSGWRLRDEFAAYDAEKQFELPPGKSYEMPGCRCGQVITGRCIPTECPMFGKVCTPRDPLGPCMVSSEGTCAAYYKYHWRPTPAGGPKA